MKQSSVDHLRRDLQNDSRIQRALAAQQHLRSAFCRRYSPLEFARLRRELRRTLSREEARSRLNAVSRPFKAYRNPWKAWFVSGVGLDAALREPPFGGWTYRPGAYAWFSHLNCEYVGHTTRTVAERFGDSDHWLYRMPLGVEDTVALFECDATFVRRLESQLGFCLGPRRNARCG